MFARNSYKESRLDIDHHFAFCFRSSEHLEGDVRATFAFSTVEELHNYVRNNASAYDAVCLHWLGNDSLKLGRELLRKSVVIPFLWGGEIYHTFRVLRDTLFLPETKAFLDASSTQNRLKRILRRLGRRDQSREDAYLRFLNAVPAIVPVCLEEGKKYRDELGINTPNLEHAYIVRMPKHNGIEKPDTPAGSEDVLLGNSAASTGNHLDVLSALSRDRGFKGNIYCPLAYGGHESYIQAVISRGKEYFGERFKPQREFVSLEEYTKMISSCKFILMGHRRQQAGGNIRLSLSQGKTVFLQNENTFFDMYSNLGVTVCSMEEYRKAPDLTRVDLSPRQVKDNQEILRDAFAPERLIERNDKLFETILSMRAVG